MTLYAEALGDDAPRSTDHALQLRRDLDDIGPGATMRCHYFEQFVAGVEAQRDEAGRDSAETQRAQFSQYLRGYHAFLDRAHAHRDERARRLGVARTHQGTDFARADGIAIGRCGERPSGSRFAAESCWTTPARIGELDTRIVQTANSGEREALKAQRNTASRELAEMKLQLQKKYPRFRQITNVRHCHGGGCGSGCCRPMAVFVSYAVMEGDLLKALSTDATGTVTYHDLPTMPGIADTVEALRMWSANLAAGAMTDDTGRTIRILHWTDAGKSALARGGRGPGLLRSAGAAGAAAIAASRRRWRSPHGTVASTVVNDGADCIPGGATVRWRRSAISGTPGLSRQGV